jgi:phosphoribosylanthranilate isomerase
MKIKVCGMADPQNMIDLERQIKPDWMGIICYPLSSRYVSSDSGEEIRKIGLPKVGVFVNANIAEIAEKIDAFGLQVLQLHGDESVEEVSAIKEAMGLPIFKVFSIKDEVDWNQLEPFLPYVDYFLFDTFTPQYGGSGRQFNWEILMDYPYEKPFLLSGGIGLDNIHAVKLLHQRFPKMEGIDVNSKFEIRPGYKDINMLQSMCEILNQEI